MLSFRGFYEITGLHARFLNKVFIWTRYKKAFPLEGYVICFVSAYNA